MAGTKRELKREALWYKDAIIYELHVRSFFDSNADGIGDLPGLTQKLDYLQELGVTCLWLLPFYPSPLKDDGYDIADYYSINPIYGTLADFNSFLKEAHLRGLRVVTELVINHTSDQHGWFQKSRRAKPGSPWRDFYVWTDDPKKYKDARIIFKDFEPSNWSWDPVAQAYFWHRFYSHQPDLNFDNPLVHQEIFKVLDFWCDRGVDGFRLDAIPYLYEREGTSCESLPETHAFLKKLRRHVDEKYGDRLLLAEANQWPEEAVTYFGGGTGDECHMAFHFPLMPRLFMSLRMEDQVPIVDIIEQTPALPATSQWALFLRNHDELTLEMVTDEERDYMYRVYASDVKARLNLGIRRRLAPLLGNDRKRIELLNMLLFSLPGTPVLYYGDELGMGDNVFLGDRHGVRTPMHWTSDRNAGFSKANPHAVVLPLVVEAEYHYQTVNVEAQQQNPHSLLWWTRRIISLRKRWKAFGRGSLEFLPSENRKVLAFIRRFEGELILVVANLSRFPQPALLNLAEFQGHVPVELFGRTSFPAVGSAPYALSLGPHSAFWFSLEKKTSEVAGPGEAGERPMILLKNAWTEALTGSGRSQLDAGLPSFLRHQAWFDPSRDHVAAARLDELLPMRIGSEEAFVGVLTVDYAQHEQERFLLPLAYATGRAARQIESDFPERIIARVNFSGGRVGGVIHDSLADPDFARAMLDLLQQRHAVKGRGGKIEARPTEALRELRRESGRLPRARLLASTRRNTTFLFGQKLFLKLLRRLEVGTNPEVEVGLFLGSRPEAVTPAMAGWLEYSPGGAAPIPMGILSAAVPNSHSGWDHALDSLGRFFERVGSLPEEQDVPLPKGSLVGLAKLDPPAPVAALIGTYLESARLLGQRTAELHLALSADPQNPDFAPEPFTPFYQRSLYQSMRHVVLENGHLLQRRLKSVPAPVRTLAAQVVRMQPAVIKRLRSVFEIPIPAMRIRCHGDFHLGEVLYTGKDFVVVDFEGESSRPMGERRIKRSPLRDVAGMIRSFHYATHAALRQQVERGLEPGGAEALCRLTFLWHKWVSATYLRAYLSRLEGSHLLPEKPEAISVLLEAHLLSKTFFQLGQELNDRPDWLQVPLDGVLELMESPV